MPVRERTVAADGRCGPPIPLEAAWAHASPPRTPWAADDAIRRLVTGILRRDGRGVIERPDDAAFVPGVLPPVGTPLQRSGRRPPRIGIISDERYPGTEADTQQIVKNAAALARAGLPVELVIPVPSGRSFTPENARLHELLDFYHISGGLQIRSLLTIPAGPLRSVKLTHGIASPLFLLARRFDVAYTRNLLPALLCLGLGVRVVLDTYRAFGDEYPALTRAASLLARDPRFLGLLLHSRYAARSMIRAGFPRERVTVMHNGYDVEDMGPVLSREEARSRLGLATDKRLVVYAGNLQKNKGIESIMAVAERRPEVDFLLVGGRPDLVAGWRGAARGAPNVSFTGHRLVGEVPRYLYAADVLIIPPTSAPLLKHGRTVLPLKTFTYLAAGRPILAPALPDVGEILDDRNACLVAPDQPDAAAAALRDLLRDRPRMDRLGQAASDTSKTLTWDARAQRIKAWLLERIVD